MKYLKKFETFVNNTSWGDSVVGGIVNDIIGVKSDDDSEDKPETDKPFTNAQSKPEEDTKPESEPESNNNAESEPETDK